VYFFILIKILNWMSEYKLGRLTNVESSTLGGIQNV